ncbi:MAG: hypothetical protein DRP64_00190 [Verrucomicrobia bacterium]|nr:MAG: hypothetical protein DRP64_00190 [Verrucomicrobiota bacterium]
MRCRYPQILSLPPGMVRWVVCGVFLCCGSGVEASENLAWDQHIAQWISPQWREAQDTLKRIEGDLELLPKIPKEDSGGTGGLAFFVATKPADEDPERIIEIRWGDAVPVDLVALVPARKYYVDGVAMDYGLPEDFSVELICDREEAVYPVASEFGVRSRPLQNGHPFVYPLREPVVATGLRIKVARVLKEKSEKEPLYVMAFAEAFCFSGNRNIAKNAEVSVNYDIGYFYHWRWRNAFLVDGQTPLELPEVPAPVQQEKGWFSNARNRDDMSAWVTVDLGKRRRFDGLRIYPIRRLALGNLPGFGMPRAFQISVSDTDSPDAYSIVLDHADRNMDNPGHNPVEFRFSQTEARFIQFKALKLWKRFESYPAYLALSEVEVLNGVENIALGARVVSSDQIGRTPAHGDLVWSENSLTDGYGPGGLLVQPRAWLLGLKARMLLEVQQYELESKTASITATVRHWVFGALILLAGGGTLGSVVLPMRARLLRRREVLRVRERIAGDLHDEVGSNLGSIQILSSLAQHQMPPCDELETIQRVAAETVAAVRDIVWFLRARTTQRICLADHLKEMGGILLESLEWSLNGDDEGHTIDISDDLLRNLMLFYREALHNIIQHAQAKSVAIRLDVTKETLSLAITDDGCGIPEETLNRPPTLRALKYRAERLHGRLDVCSSPDSGTTVMLSFPLQ